MKDPRICLDGAQRNYPKVRGAEFKPGDQFAINGSVYSVVRLGWVSVPRGQHQYYYSDEALFEPYYATGHLLLNGTRYGTPDNVS